MGIKISAEELRKKRTERLIKMKEEMSMHLRIARIPKNSSPPSKGFNIKEEKKNIARINTILKERNED